MKLTQTVATAVALFLSLTSVSHAGCKKPWVFSDLGAGTLVDTSQYDFDNETGPITAATGALEYLGQLRDAGYTVGLIVNVPAEWGDTDQAKIDKITGMIDKAWTASEPMPWDQFTGRFFVPDTNEHRKPDPFLFNKAVALAASHGCRALYLGTLAKEMPGAEAAGMAAFNVGHTDPENRFPPVSEIPAYVKGYRAGAWNPAPSVPAPATDVP